jgi:metal transporter CNNM
MLIMRITVLISFLREIIDESDVYIDVHKAIRRIAPAPKARVGKGHFVSDTDASPLLGDYFTDLNDKNTTNDGRQQDKIGSISSRSKSPAIYGSSPKTTILMKKGSADPDGGPRQPIALRSNANDLREHLKYLGPSNLASRPKSTRYNSVKIKPGYPAGSDFMPRQPSFPEIQEHDPEHPSQPGGENEALLKGTNGEYSGAQTMQQGYGAIDISRVSRNMVKSDHSSKSGILRVSQNRKVSPLRSSARSGGSGERRSDQLRNLPSRDSSPTRRKRFPARSGSITESYIDAGGVRKVVLETNSSSDDPDSESKNEGMGKSDSSSSMAVHLNDGNGYGAEPLEENMKKKQPRRKRRKKAETKSNDSRGS